MFFFKQKTAYEMRISDWSSDVCSSDLIMAEPFDDLLDPARLAVAALRAKRRIGGEQDAFGEPDRRALAEARERRDEEPFLPECGPIALRIFEQTIGHREPDGPPAPLEPVVEDNPRDLPQIGRASCRERVCQYV